MSIHRAGGKLTNNHTTTTEIVSKLVDFLQKQSKVTKITLSIITPLVGTRSSTTVVVKLLRESDTNVFVKVVQHGSTQEFRFYSASKVDCQEAMLATSRFIRNNDWKLKFK